MEQVLAGIRAAGEATRLRLLALLAHGELTVTEITQILGQSQPRVSRHLKLMCEAGLLDRIREGTWVFYRLAGRGAIAGLARALIAQLPAGDEGLQRDAERLAQVRAARAEAAESYFRANAGEWDRIRALHVAEELVEQALLDAVGGRTIDAFLDIGTGTGRMLQLFAGRVGHALGIDVSRDMLAVARASLDRHGIANAQVRQGDMYALDVAAASQDMILFHQVLHYAHDPAAAIAEAARALKPGGLVLIVDFAPHELEELRTQHAHRRLGFAEAEVTGWMRDAGLRPAPVLSLPGQPLNVSIWRGERQPAAAPAIKQTAKQESFV